MNNLNHLEKLKIKLNYLLTMENLIEFEYRQKKRRRFSSM